jgi:hypothetical protein
MVKQHQSSEDHEDEWLKSLAFTNEFAYLIGRFHLTWSSIDLITDFAICKFLNIPPEQGHLITSGIMFGRKARLLADLVGRSNHPKKAEILEPFNKLRGNSKRDIFTHSYISTDRGSVTFIERSISGRFTAKAHTFTFSQIQDHVLMVVMEADNFCKALEASGDEIDAFANAAFNLSRKSNTSP